MCNSNEENYIITILSLFFEFIIFALLNHSLKLIKNIKYYYACINRFIYCKLRVRLNNQLVKNIFIYDYSLYKTPNSSQEISDAELAVINAQVKQMKQILEKEEERFKSLLQSGNKDEPRNQQKGNYGEMKSCLNLLTSEKLKKGVDGKRYNLKRIGDDAPNSLDSKIRHGIDGIYENLTPLPKFIIDEAKFGASRLNPKTKDGPQMSIKWILSRVDQLGFKGIISEKIAQEIHDAVDENAVDRILTNISKNGKIDMFLITDNGLIKMDVE